VCFVAALQRTDHSSREVLMVLRVLVCVGARVCASLFVCVCVCKRARVCVCACVSVCESICV
jgi:hypothetical protein